MTWTKSRAELTEKILDIKRENAWTWKYVVDGRSAACPPVLVVGALLGQMKLTKPQCEKAAKLFGLSKGEARLLNEVPMRGAPMPPTDPLIYRFYELVMVNGPAWKALIEEEFGDGIMSAIDFDLEIERQPDPKGDRVKSRCPASSCRIDAGAAGNAQAYGYKEDDVARSKATKRSGLYYRVASLARDDHAHQCRLQWRWKLLSVQQCPLLIRVPERPAPTAPTTPPTTAPGGPATSRPVPAPAAAPTMSAWALFGTANVRHRNDCRCHKVFA